MIRENPNERKVPGKDDAPRPGIYFFLSPLAIKQNIEKEKALGRFIIIVQFEVNSNFFIARVGCHIASVGFQQ